MGNVIINAAVEEFWLVSSQLIELVVPIIAISLIFKIIYDMLLKER